MAAALQCGALAGLAEGFWLLAPLILRSHHIVVESTPQWIELVVILAALFVFLGASLGAAIGAATAVSFFAVRGSLPARGLHFALAVAIALIPAYLSSGALIYFVRFGHLGNALEYLHALTGALPALIVIMSGGAVLHRLSASSSRPSRLVAMVAVGMTVAGALVLPMRVCSRSSRKAG